MVLGFCFFMFDVCAPDTPEFIRNILPTLVPRMVRTTSRLHIIKLPFWGMPPCHHLDGADRAVLQIFVAKTSAVCDRTGWATDCVLC